MEENRVRVLGIAPYEGMRLLMTNLAEEFPQIELTLFVGDMERGLKIAQNNFSGGFDVVISRGGTAQMLRKNLTIPVVEIEITMYDILCALKLAGLNAGRAAFISQAQAKDTMDMLGDVLDYDVDSFIYSMEDLGGLEDTLEAVRSQDYAVILCDVFANTTANRLGIKTFLITSSADSIRQAYRSALLLWSSLDQMKRENGFFRQLISGQSSDTVVFRSNGELFLSTLEETTSELSELLRQEIPESLQHSRRRITRTLNGMLYSIQIQLVPSDQETFAAFYVTARKNPLPANQTGIRFFSRAEAEKMFYDSIFSYGGMIADYQDQITRTNQSQSPVVISGEDGTGKKSIAQILYIQGAYSSNTLVSVNCSQLNEKSWAFLLEHVDSPLSDSRNTIYFSNIDMLSREQLHRLLAALEDMDVCRRNRVIISCVCQPGENMSRAGAMFADKLCCLSIFLKPLRSEPERIPALVNLTLNHINMGLSRQIIGVEPEAMAMLQSFSWPHNFTQFRRALQSMAASSPENVFTAAHVNQVLRKERHVASFTSAEEAAFPLDLNRTLDEITRDIARRVTEESGGNQTLAAKRLGISRTTLWRLMKE